MSSLKTLVLAIALSTVSNLPAAAQDDLSSIFATCVGRFSAQVEHAWLIGDPATDAYEHQRRTFLSLLDATAASTGMADRLHHRIEAKYAHARLLSHADFHDDPRRKRLARRLAEARLTACNRLLLDS